MAVVVSPEAPAPGDSSQAGDDSAAKASAHTSPLGVKAGRSTGAAVLRDASLAAGIGQFAAIQAVGPIGMDLSAIDVRDSAEIERNVAEFAPGTRGGLIVTTSNFFANHPISSCGDCCPAQATRRARFTSGAISLSISSHFPVREYSKMTKPVALPPGRDKLATKPEPIGSTTPTNTIGTSRLTCCKAVTARVATPR